MEFIEKLGSQTQNSSVDKEVICVTDHPAFPAVCLNIWSLELAADNYKTRDGYRYRQLGAKERYIKLKSIFLYSHLYVCNSCFLISTLHIFYQICTHFNSV